METYEIHKRVIALGFKNPNSSGHVLISIWKWLEDEMDITIKLGPGYSWEFQYGDSIYKSSKLDQYRDHESALSDAMEFILRLIEEKDKTTSD